MPPDAVSVRMPRVGVWRVARKDDPLRIRPPRRIPPGDKTAGNRFDSISGRFGVLYFATQLEGCYTEVLARFRTDPDLVDLVRDEWDARGWMRVGNVPASWRKERISFLVQPREDEEARFLDVESLDTRLHLDHELEPVLRAWDAWPLNVDKIRGEDRRVTRLIGEWAYDQVDEIAGPLYAGVRYLSKIDTDRECWAVFDDVGLDVQEYRAIRSDQAALTYVARKFGLTIH